MSGRTSGARPGRAGARALAALAALAALVPVLWLGGCAQPAKPMYHWGGYERQVYAYLNSDTSTAAEQLGILQAQAEKARAQQAALPPGFRAHVGLLQLHLGNPDEARRQLQAEKAAFAEAAPFMDFLLARLDQRPAAAPAAPGSASPAAKPALPATAASAAKAP
ncbi:DUF4810 domain-containing protein [Aquabacterium sp. OR-4]|uniref:DUF4810 domain-containing protein n=1 Tax=Aquabacterium sp. OR-4 TaxID=2978127 RepID=UPI0021B2C803|nr:DUF4810 domain-containing protein [Aquabacterium sp. OR-4]MDT7836848.1 DUF4810 domain-containing protein [Aquabacterium sp. OR-4]